MPTFNRYNNETGYYIRARPSDTGNITYQIDPAGEQILEKIGYADGDSLDWEVLKSLRVAGLIHTGDRGVSAEDPTIDLEKQEIDSLSAEDAEQLLNQLSSTPQVGNSEVSKIREILDVDDKSGFELETFAKETKQLLLEQNVVEDSRQRNLGKDYGPVELLLSYDDKRGTDGPCVQYYPVDFVIEFIAEIYDNPHDQPGGVWVTLEILMSEKHGIIACENDISIRQQNIRAVIDYQRFLTDLLPTIFAQVETTELGD